jgi:hypothetical protein
MVMLAVCIWLTGGFVAAARNIIVDGGSLDFRATVKGSQVMLRWSAASETQPGYFVLQRSTNGREYSDVAMIMSDTSLPESSYTYSESYSRNIAATFYYRIKMVKSDGTSSFSGVQTVKLRLANATESSIMPNFITSELRINGPRPVNMKRKKAALLPKTAVYVVRLKSAAEQYN